MVGVHDVMYMMMASVVLLCSRGTYDYDGKIYHFQFAFAHSLDLLFIK